MVVSFILVLKKPCFKWLQNVSFKEPWSQNVLCFRNRSNGKPRFRKAPRPHLSRQLAGGRDAGNEKWNDPIQTIQLGGLL